VQTVSAGAGTTIEPPWPDGCAQPLRTESAMVINNAADLPKHLMPYFPINRIE